MINDEDDYPSAKALSPEMGYTQVYAVKDHNLDDKDCDGNSYEVLFRCGNWCYKGQIQFNDIEVTTSEIPVIIPVLQKQQGSLRYFCHAEKIPYHSEFYMPFEWLSESVEFFATEMQSESVTDELVKMSKMFNWIDNDDDSTYFEMQLGDLPDYMLEMKMIACKTYTRGLIIISVYSEGKLFFVVQSGEGDQALLDVRFPDVSQHGQGVQLAIYQDHTVSYRKLTLWHSMGRSTSRVVKMPKLKSVDVSSSEYQQTYCIMKSSWDDKSPKLSVHHDCLFRFGSWCYSGRVQLTSVLNLEDIPLIIPALRMQQSRLDFLCETREVPTTSPFSGALKVVSETGARIMAQLEVSEEILASTIDSLSATNQAEAKDLEKWVEGDANETFFEFSVEMDSILKKDLKNIEMIASKTYHASGVITVSIYFQNSIYVCVQDAGNENPLLDSKFPNISNKGRGFQIQCFSEKESPEHWPQLRRVQMWQNSDVMLEKAGVSVDHMADAKSAGNEKSGGQGQQEIHMREGDGWAEVRRSNETTSEAKSGHKSEREESPERETPSNSTATAASQESTMARRGSKDVEPEVSERLEGLTIEEKHGASPAHTEDIENSHNENLRDNNNSQVLRAESKTGDSPVKARITLDDFSKNSSPSMGRIARPHHLPKMQGLNDGLSKRMESIKNSMQAEVSLRPYPSLSVSL